MSPKILPRIPHLKLAKQENKTVLQSVFYPPDLEPATYPSEQYLQSFTKIQHSPQIHFVRTFSGMAWAWLWASPAFREVRWADKARGRSNIPTQKPPLFTSQVPWTTQRLHPLSNALSPLFGTTFDELHIRVAVTMSAYLDVLLPLL